MSAVSRKDAVASHKRRRLSVKSFEVGESKKVERRKWRPVARRYSIEMAAKVVSIDNLQTPALGGKVMVRRKMVYISKAKGRRRGWA